MGPTTGVVDHPRYHRHGPRASDASPARFTSTSTRSRHRWPVHVSDESYRRSSTLRRHRRNGRRVGRFHRGGGDFSVPVAYVPEAAGSFILCGYLSEMVYDDA